MADNKYGKSCDLSRPDIPVVEVQESEDVSAVTPIDHASMLEGNRHSVVVAELGEGDAGVETSVKIDTEDGRVHVYSSFPAPTDSHLAEFGEHGELVRDALIKHRQSAGKLSLFLVRFVS